MPKVRVTEHSRLAPDVILAAARDFSDRRAQMWPDVHVEHLQVHEIGETHAEVTEGNPWPIGHVWERLRYDWSQPNALLGTVLDSNLFKPGSTWELWAPYVICVVAVGYCFPSSFRCHTFLRPRPCDCICGTF